METSTLTDRIEILEAADAVRELRHRFNLALDAALEDYGADAVARLRATTTPGFRWSSALHGALEGIDAFVGVVERCSARCDLSFRIVASDLHHSHDDLDIARVTWSTLGMLTIDGQQLWVASAQNDTYVRSGGGWLIDAVDVDYKFVCRYEDGWTDQRFVEEALVSGVV